MSKVPTSDFSLPQEKSLEKREERNNPFLDDTQLQNRRRLKNRTVNDDPYLNREEQIQEQEEISRLHSAEKADQPSLVQRERQYLAGKNLLFKRLENGRVLIRKYAISLDSSIDWEITLSRQEWDFVNSTLDEPENTLLYGRSDSATARISAFNPPGSPADSAPIPPAVGNPSVETRTADGAKVVAPATSAYDWEVELKKLEEEKNKAEKTDVEKKLGEERAGQEKPEALLGKDPNKPEEIK